MSKFVMECPNCGKYVEAKKGFFARKKIDCTCGCTIDVRTDKLASRVCPHCGNHVVFDRSKGAKAGWMGLALLISVSVVFVKQHSVIDLGAGLALSALGWALIYGKTARKRAYRTSLKAPRRSVSGRETA